VPVYNAPEIVRWNIDKGYLAGLGARGVATIPTLLLDNHGPAEIVAGLRSLRAASASWVEAHASAQGRKAGSSSSAWSPPAADWRMGHAAPLVQPFLPGVVEEGERSLTCRRWPVQPRPDQALQPPAITAVQSLYGGWDTAVTPAPDDLAAAQKVIAGLPFPPPLYARIDLVRGQDGTLLLMEAELIEPFLYPLQGPELGQGSLLAFAACLLHLRPERDR
jgi:hypothetical protein